MTDNIIKPEYESLIFKIRGFNVMIDADLASLYDTETKVLKQQVKRNQDRFPKNFMFQLTKKEKLKLVTNCDRLSSLKHSSVNPMVFTEQGVAMLSSVLRSKMAITINIEIVRTFVFLRKTALQYAELWRKLTSLEEKYDDQFKEVFSALKLLLRPPIKPRKQIGFKSNEELS
jgi:hypothetical protein